MTFEEHLSILLKDPVLNFLAAVLVGLGANHIDSPLSPGWNFTIGFMASAFILILIHDRSWKEKWTSIPAHTRQIIREVGFNLFASLLVATGAFYIETTLSPGWNFFLSFAASEGILTYLFLRRWKVLLKSGDSSQKT